MALNAQVFKTRTLTSIVFVAIMLCGLLLNYTSFVILFIIINIGCLLEYFKIAGLINPDYNTVSIFHKCAVMLAGLGFLLWMTKNFYSLHSITLSKIGLYIMVVSLCFLLIDFALKRNINIILISIICLLYISLSCGLIINLRSEGMIPGNLFMLDFGLILPLTIIASIWINDTMAYIVGSLIGKTPLTSISPKKTWEGTIGGALLSITTITILGYIFLKADIWQLIIISAIACVAGIFGDLFESKLKRMANVKDSGNIMPGHGGFLDRFDSLLVATIFVWLYVKLLMV